MLTIFSHQKSSTFFVLMLDAVQIRRFFFLSATLHTQKKVKEIAYILTSYQALLKVQHFFLLFVYLIRDNMMEMKFLFVCTFLQLIQVFVNN